MINTWHSYFFGCWQVKFTALPWANVCKIISSTFRGSRQGSFFSNVWIETFWNNISSSIWWHLRLSIWDKDYIHKVFNLIPKRTHLINYVRKWPNIYRNCFNSFRRCNSWQLAKKNKIWKWNCINDYEEENHADPQNPPTPTRQSMVIGQEPLILTYSRGPM